MARELVAWEGYEGALEGVRKEAKYSSGGRGSRVDEKRNEGAVVEGSLRYPREPAAALVSRLIAVSQHFDLWNGRWINRNINFICISAV